MGNEFEKAGWSVHDRSQASLEVVRLADEDRLELRVGLEIDGMQIGGVWTHLSGYFLFNLVHHLGVSFVSILLIAVEVCIDQLLGT